MYYDDTFHDGHREQNDDCVQFGICRASDRTFNYSKSLQNAQELNANYYRLNRDKEKKYEMNLNCLICE